MASSIFGWREKTDWKFSELEIGQSFFVPDYGTGVTRIRQYAYIRGKTLGMKFAVRKRPTGFDQQGGYDVVRTA